MDLPYICNTTTPIYKDKVQVELEVACWGRVRSMQYKASQITHELARLLLGLRFHSKDLDRFRDKVTIFMFPDLSLY